VVLRPTGHKTGHFGDVSPRHSLGLVWKKLNLTQQKRALTNQKKCTHTCPFNDPFSGTTQVTRYHKGKANLDFTEERDSEWQWHPLGHMQVLLQTDNHTSTPPLFVFYRLDALPAAQPTASKH